jgi:hypothetical protein
MKRNHDQMISMKTLTFFALLAVVWTLGPELVRYWRIRTM